MNNTDDLTARRLPRRDLLILPLLSLLTILFLLVGSELASRHFFAEGGKDSCEVDDARIGFTFRPRCVSRVKASEGPWVQNSYNDCGYRTAESCGPKPPGAIRIALIGSSVAQGWHIEYEKTFAARSAKELTFRCGRPAQVQNLGRQMCSLACMFHRVDEALALKPDVLLVAVSPYDIETILPSEVEDRYKPIPPRGTSGNLVETQQRHLLVKRVQRLLIESRSVLAAEHFLFQDPSTFLNLWLINKDKADFLRPPFSPKWEERLANVDLLLGEIAQKAHAVNVPVVLVEVPNLAQAAILSTHDTRPGVSADALNQRLQEISSKNGVTFVNVLDRFRQTTDSNRLYYVVDGHLNGDGNALISGPIVDKLTEDKNPLLPGCMTSRQEKEEASK